MVQEAGIGCGSILLHVLVTWRLLALLIRLASYCCLSLHKQQFQVVSDMHNPPTPEIRGQQPSSAKWPAAHKGERKWGRSDGCFQAVFRDLQQPPIAPLRAPWLPWLLLSHPAAVFPLLLVWSLTCSPQTCHTAQPAQVSLPSSNLWRGQDSQAREEDGPVFSPAHFPNIQLRARWFWVAGLIQAAGHGLSIPVLDHLGPKVKEIICPGSKRGPRSPKIPGVVHLGHHLSTNFLQFSVFA